MKASGCVHVNCNAPMLSMGQPRSLKLTGRCTELWGLFWGWGDDGEAVAGVVAPDARRGAEVTDVRVATQMYVQSNAPVQRAAQGTAPVLMHTI